MGKCVLIECSMRRVWSSGVLIVREDQTVEGRKSAKLGYPADVTARYGQRVVSVRTWALNYARFMNLNFFQRNLVHFGSGLIATIGLERSVGGLRNRARFSTRAGPCPRGRCAWSLERAARLG